MTKILITFSLLGAGFFLYMKNKMQISQAGIDSLKQFEGYSADKYQDVAGLWTIGYGHLIKPGENFETINEATAEKLLRQDIGIAERAVNELVTVDLTQGQYDALVSFVYNVGAGAFKKSTLLRKLNIGDYVGALNELPRWNKAGGKIQQGLANRRVHEQQLFLA